MDTQLIRDQVMRNSTAAKQVAQLPSGCKACMREGLAIYPLRVAAITTGTSPSWQPSVPDQAITLSGGEYKYALRTLREGYLYVLLDNIIWQAYQVTAEGHIREFYCKHRPEDETVEPLNSACREANHDIIASFINIDTKTYSQAEIAFSSDPWSPEVLAAYVKQRPPGRFTHVDLKAFQASPGKHARGMALDFSLSSLTERVTEFHTDFFPQPGIAIGPYSETVQGGAHGFHPRKEKTKFNAMSGKVMRTIDTFGSAGAIILDDPIGVIQELNSGRLQLIQDCHDYTSRTEVRHRFMTSQAITRTLKAVQDTISKNSQPEFGRPDSGYPAAMHQITSAEDVAKRTMGFELARINACYSETARLTFERQYKNDIDNWQEKIAAVDSDLAAWYQGKAWLTVMDHDYAPQENDVDWFLHMKTLSVCLQGGPMKHSDAVWLDWMKTPDSPAYVGLLAQNHTQNAAVFSNTIGLSGLRNVLTPDTSSILAGSAGYSYLKTAGGSDEMANMLKHDPVQLLVTGRIMALNAAVSRLKDRLDDATRSGYSRMLQGTAYSTYGETVHLLELDTTIGRFQRLVNLFPNAWSDLSVASFGGSGQSGFAAATGGLTKITNEKLLNLPLTIRIASTEPGAQAALDALPHASTPEKISAVSGLRVASISLKGPEAPAVSPESLLTERNRRFLSGNSVGLVLSAVMLGLQISDWQQNTDNLEQAVSGHTDASMTLAINRLMVVSAASEIGGFSHMMVTRMNWALLEKRGFVHPLIKAGGILAGAAAVIDGVRMLVLSNNERISGDYISSSLYFIGGVSTFAGGTMGIISSWNGVFALAGMAGLGALLIFVGAGIAYTAAQYRSTPLEVWLRSSCFGINRHDSDVVWYEKDTKALSSMLDAWYAVMSGMVAEVAFSAPTIIYGEYYREIEMKLVLPGYQDGISGLQYRLTADVTELVSVSLNIDGTPDITSVNPRCLNPESKRIVTDDAVVLLVRISVKETQVASVTLTASFWPDVKDANYREGLTVKADS
ncbi:hypothetical protein GJV06_07585 [Enterobacteriaceae bacterium RIT691]|nr:hypothetical protein [Enterobacteriaceae bacterium RIT691]